MDEGPLMWPLAGGGNAAEMRTVFSGEVEPVAIFVSAERPQDESDTPHRYFRLCKGVRLAGDPHLCPGWIVEEKEGGYILARRRSRKRREAPVRVGRLRFSGPWGSQEREVMLFIGERRSRLKDSISAIQRPGNDQRSFTSEKSFISSLPAIRTFQGEEEEEGPARKRRNTRAR